MDLKFNGLELINEELLDAHFSQQYSVTTYFFALMASFPDRVKFRCELRGRILETVEREDLSEHPAESNASDTVPTFIK